MATQLLPAGDSPGYGRALLHFLLRTRLGNLFFILLVLRLLEPTGLLPVALSTLVQVGLSIYVLAFAVWGILRLRRKLLWRIRRKLMISYFLIGLVPTVLILFFFLLTAFLVFGQVSSYLLSVSLERTGIQSAHVADLAVADLLRAHGARPELGNDAIQAILSSRIETLTETYPGASAVFLEGANGKIRRYLVVGNVEGLPLPGADLPEWARDTYAGLMQLGEKHVVAGFSQPMPKTPEIRVLVTLPLSSAFEKVEKETELRIQQAFSATAETTPDGTTLSSPGIGVLTPPADEPGFSLPWVALLEARAWGSSENALFVFFRFSFMSVFRVFARHFPELGHAILAALGVLAGLFLVIEVLAIFVGLLLARSITSSVHALSQGTEHVRHGDFSYKVQVRSRDQLGELAESFNLMTGSIQDLLRQSAEKERLEEELRIARQIQMSLLPKDRVNMPGVSIAAMCLPATEVGGDYYDFIPLDDQRLALLVADVSGKGTSAALYMAELKGIMLSLSKIYDSPRKLLIEANTILVQHLDSRSFITMVYAVIDMNRHRMTFARAGHNPIYYLSGDGDSAMTRVLAPEGLGLALDRSGQFDKILAEESVHLSSGDLFLFFTDGLSEAMNPSADLFGESRLRQILERHGDRSLEELRERIIDEIFAFVEGEDQHDDMTMVLVRIL